MLLSRSNLLTSCVVMPSIVERSLCSSLRKSLKLKAAALQLLRVELEDTHAQSTTVFLNIVRTYRNVIYTGDSTVETTSAPVRNGGSRMEEEATVSVLLCNFCDLRCYEDRSLLKHIRNVHGNDPNFVVYCNKCGRSYKKWSYLKKHLHREHSSMLF